EAGMGCPAPRAPADPDGAAAEAYASGSPVWREGGNIVATSAAVPVRSRSDSLGVLLLSGRPGRLFDRAALGSLTAAAGQIGRFCERVRQDDLLQARARQQAALAELSQRAVADSNTDALMARMVELVADTVGAEMTGVLRLLPDGASLALRAAAGWPDGVALGQKVGAGPDTQAGLTLLTNAPVLVQDVAAETRFSTIADQALGVVSSICVPVGGRRRPFGVLAVYSRTRRSFTGDDVFFLESAAGV